MAASRAPLIDIGGVLVTSWRALPGAVDAFTALRSAGVPLRLITNLTSPPKEQLRDGGLAPDVLLDSFAGVPDWLSSL